MKTIEYGSIQVSSPTLISILEDVLKIDLLQSSQLNFVIIGETGVGKHTMAQFVQKTVYKNKDIKIIRQIDQPGQICGNINAIYTISPKNWIQLRSSFQQLQLHVISMPTLKERKNDLASLANFFLQVLCLMSGQNKFSLTEKSIEVITQYNWPGQFYEFESVIENALESALKSHSNLLIEPEHLSLHLKPQNFEFSVGMKLDEIERQFILQTLYFVHQNRTKAAEILGISIRTLRNKINQYREEGFL